MTVVFAPEAETDLQNALDYIAERNPTAARKLALGIFATLEKLAESQVDGPAHLLTTGERVRGWLIPPFRVFYERRNEVLYVVRVYHHARRPLAE